MADDRLLPDEVHAAVQRNESDYSVCCHAPVVWWEGRAYCVACRYLLAETGWRLMRHIDEFIADPTSDPYAAKWFASFRRPELDKLREPNEAKLFATYNGKRWRVTGCSRMGDVWLHSNFAEDTTYEKRVDVSACSEWSCIPERP